MTRRNRSTGRKFRDKLPQAEVQVPSQQCLVCLVAVADCQQFTKCRTQQCELSNVFSAPFVALRDLNAHSFMIKLQGRQRGSLSASTGCGWRTDAWSDVKHKEAQAAQQSEAEKAGGQGAVQETARSKGSRCCCRVPNGFRTGTSRSSTSRACT